jgi:hypothetical protein
MAASQTAYISKVATQRDIDESQELQDRGIRTEFRNVHQKLDEQRLYMVDRFQQVDDRFQQVDDRFQQFDDRFQQVDDRFQQVDDRLSELEVLIKNSRATSGWDDILPVRVKNPLIGAQDRYLTPLHFPSRVVKFWRLQRPRHQRHLIELLRFYRIRASDLISATLEDNDDTESESSYESSSTLERVTLEEAVRANPAFALARLAARLGLDFHSIQQNMGLYEQIQMVKTELEKQRTKRERSKEEGKDDDTGPSKKTAITEVIQAHRSGTGIPLEALLACPDEFQCESPQALSHVGWAPPSLPLRVQASSSKDAASTPSSPSKGSTVAFTHTPSVVKGARKTTPYCEGTP